MQTALYFPDGKAENVLRGMAGLLIPRVAPKSAAGLLHPVWPGAPSGYATPPKPFLFRAFPLDGLRFQAGDTFAFDVHQFAPALPVKDVLVQVMALLETEGLGPGRGRIRLLDVETWDSLHSLDASEEVNQLTLRFLSPADISPVFPALIARLHDRINALSTLYGGHPPLPPLERAEVEIRRDGTSIHSRQRQSTRTGQRYDTRGIKGEIEYSGSLTGALPFLRLGQWTGIGNGFYEIVG